MRPALLAASALAFATPAFAQQADPHAGHQMPAAPASAQPPADPHAGHVMTGSASPPPVPTDNAADAVFDPKAMAQARETLRMEHGAMSWRKLMVETAEFRSGDGEDGYGWEGQYSLGGDINRLVLKSEGEGEGGDLEQAEVQALYSRAITPYFNLQAGVRHDIRPRPERTYAVIGVEGLAPYWFELGAFAFLSDEGELSGRVEGSFDLRLTQRLVLEPRAELDFAAEDAPDLGLGSGFTTAETGLRLRYAITPEFAPYLGVHYERRLGDTADIARAGGEDVEAVRFVAGARAWF